MDIVEIEPGRAHLTHRLLRIGAVQDKMNLGDELKLSDLFEFPTLAGFSDHLQSLMAPSEEWGKI